MSVVKSIKLQVLIIFIQVGLLKDLKQRIAWILVAILFLSISQFGLPNFTKTYVVESTSPYRVVVRNGLNTYVGKGNHTYEMGDEIEVNQLTRNKEGNHNGSFNTESTKLMKHQSLRHKFWSRLNNYENTKRYFLHDQNTLFSYLSLQLTGLLRVVESIYTFYFKEKYFKYLEILLIVAYGFFFGWAFSIIRILLQVLSISTPKQMVILLLLFPGHATHPSFCLVYLPYLIRHLHTSLLHINAHGIRIFLLWNLLGRINLLDLFLYRYIRLVAGMISMFTFLHLTVISEFILKILQSINLNRIAIIGAPSLIWLGIFFIRNKKNQRVMLVVLALMQCYNPLMRVTMINVYQGDALLIQYPFNAYTILIDTGKKQAYNTLKKALYKQGVRNIDVVIISHDDEDHSGALDLLSKDFKVDAVVKEHDASVLGMVSLNSNHYDNDNDNSLVHYMSVMDTSFLFTGDIGVGVERDIIKRYPNLEVDVLKLGHHGSKTSTSDALLRSIKPRIGLISSDPKVYRHPHKEVMALLHKHRVVSVETSQEGNISFYITPFFDFVVSEQMGFGILKKRVIK